MWGSAERGAYVRGGHLRSPGSGQVWVGAECKAGVRGTQRTAQNQVASDWRAGLDADLSGQQVSQRPRCCCFQRSVLPVWLVPVSVPAGGPAWPQAVWGEGSPQGGCVPCPWDLGSRWAWVPTVHGLSAEFSLSTRDQGPVEGCVRQGVGWRREGCGHRACPASGQPHAAALWAPHTVEAAGLC